MALEGESPQGWVIWITGLAGSGKTTLGRAVYEALRREISHVVYLDGDGFREIFGHSGYDRESRIEISKKRSALCAFLASQGIHVVATAISMFDEIYRLNRQNIPHYLEVYVKCEMEELIRRDQKNLYTKALKGEIQEVVGVDIAFDEPSAHVVIDNTLWGSIDEKRDRILSEIYIQGIR